MEEPFANKISGSIGYSGKIPSRIRITTWISIIIVGIICFLDIAGWLFDIQFLKGIRPHWTTMKVVSAILFIFSATALLLLKQVSPTRWKIIAARTLTAVINLISLCTIAVYIYHFTEGSEPVGPGTPLLSLFLLPGTRMSLLTSCNFLLIGVILLLLARRRETDDNIAHILIFPVALTGYYTIISYLLNFNSIYEPPDVPIALNSGIAFCALFIAILMIRPHTWLMRVFASRSLGGYMARRLLPGLMILPIIIGRLGLFGEHMGLFRSEIGVAIVAVTYTLSFVLLIWLAARSVNRTDEARFLFEEALLKSHKDMEDINYRLSNELRERIIAENSLIRQEAQLRELIATKDKFFNIVAHDLKNPFTSMLGSTELLFENIDRLDIEDIRRLAQILNESAKSGYVVLQNLLDWSRSQTGLLKFSPEKISLTKLIEDNIENMRLYATNKQIKLDMEADKDMLIFTDKNMVNTVLRNLISNAIKFTRSKGKVRVRLIRNSNEVTVSVKDTGTGMSDENIEKLFRLDSKFQLPGTANEQGTGLGLKLCKEFVDKLGGKIWVESVENKGSEFKFTLPLQEELVE